MHRKLPSSCLLRSELATVRSESFRQRNTSSGCKTKASRSSSQSSLRITSSTSAYLVDQIKIILRVLKLLLLLPHPGAKASTASLTVLATIRILTKMVSRLSDVLVARE